jgi:hypothetical protein
LSTMVHPTGRQRQASRIASGHSDPGAVHLRAQPWCQFSLTNLYRAACTSVSITPGGIKPLQIQKDAEVQAASHQGNILMSASSRQGRLGRRQKGRGAHPTTSRLSINTLTSQRNTSRTSRRRKFQPVPWVRNFHGTGRQPPATPCWQGACKLQHYQMAEDARAGRRPRE